MKSRQPESEDRLAMAAQPLMAFRAKLVLCLNLILQLGIGNSHAQELQPSEYQLKAAFLFNFARFAEWPPGAFESLSAPIVIGILGDNPFGGDLERTIRNKTVNARPLQVREFRSVTEASTNCHILFISNSEKLRLPEILRSLQGASVLTVGQTDRFTETGGMINFIQENNKIRFQINNEAARAAGLRISSKLLSLAVASPR